MARHSASPISARFDLRAPAAASRRSGPGALRYRGDGAIPATTGRLVEAVSSAYGRIDGLGNIAGTSPPIALEAMTEFDRIMQVTHTAIARRPARPRDRERGGEAEAGNTE